MAQGLHLQSRDTMAEWLRTHAPGVTVEMYRGRPVGTGRRTLPSEAEQRSILEEAIAFPTVPMVASRIRADGPKEPLGGLLTMNGKQIEEGRSLRGISSWRHASVPPR
jgi:hypothetical protein